MRQVRRGARVRYRILGLALVSGWDGGYFFLEGFAPDGTGSRRGPTVELELLSTQELLRCEAQGVFDPQSLIDGRQRIVTAIVQRQGQPKFRAELINAYSWQCAISNYDVIETLEASHILPCHGLATNRLANGFLLRSDLHTLFDLGLLAIDSSSMGILIAPHSLKAAMPIWREQSSAFRQRSPRGRVFPRSTITDPGRAYNRRALQPRAQVFPARTDSRASNDSSVSNANSAMHASCETAARAVTYRIGTR